ncbi:MAG: hypothetical protein ACTSUE_18970 [Promethearchaeota archaeon]
MNKSFEKIVAGIKYWNLELEPPQLHFETRMILQKLAYLCKALGMDLDYNFNLYLNGPYCSALADDYYKSSDSIVTLNVSYQPTLEEIGVFKKIREDIINHPKFENYPATLLEATSTIMFLAGADPNLSDDGLFSKTKEIKPHLKDLMVVIAIDIVKKLKFNPDLVSQDFKDEMKIWENADD